MKKIGILGLVLVLTIGAFAGISRAADNNQFVSVTFDPNNYPTGVPPNWYTPGDSITIRLQGDGNPDGVDDVYDVIIFESPATCATPFVDKLEYWDDVALDDNGEATVVYDGDDTKSLDDDFYDVEILDKDYIENSGAVGFCYTTGDPDFYIQLYAIDLYPDRNGYVPGDEVDVFYSVYNIKDGSPADTIASDMEGEWDFVSSDAKSDDSGDFTDASGVIDLAIDNQGDVAGFYILNVWVNGTSDGGDRELFWEPTSMVVNVGPLTVSVQCIDLTGGTVIEGDTLQVRATTGAGGFGPEPGIDVEIEILEGTGTSASKISGYGGNFVSDSNGEVNYIFQLGSEFVEGDSYTCKAIADHPQSPQKDEDEVTFDVEAPTGVISVAAVFDKGQYMSGDSVEITVKTSSPFGHSDPNTYSLTVFPGFCGAANILHLEIQTTNVFTWTIPNNFEGVLCFRIEAYNVEGDYGRTETSYNIDYGIVVVSASPEEYSGGNTITVTYSLLSNVMTSPSYYYRVRDAGGNTVDANSTSGGSFTFTVPVVPSNSYTFRVYASDNGRTIWSQDDARLIRGFFLSITFDREIYSLGDTMKITYEITPRGDSSLPLAFTFSYGLLGGPMEDYQTTSASGELTYKIPSQNMNEGTLLFTISEGSTSTTTIEAITVRGGNPLMWAKLAEIPAFSIILLILIIILFILLYRMMRGGAAPAPRAPEEAAISPAGEMPPPPPPAGTAPAVAAAAAPSAFSIPCNSCGSPIELTTSKRPIEVMCPSCGDTQMVY